MIARWLLALRSNDEHALTRMGYARPACNGDIPCTGDGDTGYSVPIRTGAWPRETSEIMKAALPTCIIADDHAIVRDIMILRLEEDQVVEIVGSAPNGAAALELIRSLAPDIALLDLRMPAATGIEVARSVRDEGLPTKVIVYSACIEESMVYAAFEAGAHGYISKESSIEAVSAAVECVLTGHPFVDSTIIDFSSPESSRG